MCDTLGNPTGFHLTAEQRHKLLEADIIMTKLTLSKVVIANKVYDADKCRRHKLQAAGYIAVMPSKRRRRTTITHDRHLNE